MGVLFVLCGVLGVLQYRWIGEVSIAERERLQGSLQATLNRLSQDFNSEIITACRAIQPTSFSPDLDAAEAEIAARYEQWKRAPHHNRLFRRIAIAARQDETIVLRGLDFETGRFVPIEWPADWTRLRERMEAWPNRRPPGPPGLEDGLVFELPLFPPGLAGAPLGMRALPRRDAERLILELNLPYVRDVMLPEVLQRHLGAGGAADYETVVLTRSRPPAVVYQSEPNRAQRIAAGADASVGLLEIPFLQIFRRWGPPGMRERGPGPAGRGSDAGRWQMFVRHRAGSLEAAVSRTRWRNLAVTAAVLLLLAASLAALIRFTRRAQKLAELQMEFVAGVSHQLRTPLTVIHTAAFNLRGKMAGNPSQVERYGALIQQESGRLKELVEQVLQFAGAQAGRVIRQVEPLAVESVIDETVESSKATLQGARLEKKVASGLPPILGDPVALKQALENLLNNAAKYGSEGSNWIGVSASEASENQRTMIEIRVTDHGPGIPEDEQKHIFDPFFRGRRAVQDQVHGTGLGLNLVKKIIEAHGGSIRVDSAPGKGTEFVVRIPAAPAGAAA